MAWDADSDLSVERLVRLADAAEEFRGCWEQSGSGPPLLSEIALQPFLEACLKSEEDHPGCGFDLVYHWTKADKIPSIAEHGLLVADGFRVPVAHGRKYGEGVYTSPWFGFGKGRYGDVALLCIGLRGTRETRDGPSRPRGRFGVGGLASLETDEMIVYRDASQVLPCAVVAESELGRALEVADFALAMLYYSFPKLQETTVQAQALAKGTVPAEAQAVIDRWRAATHYLANPHSRLVREMAGMMHLDGILAIDDKKADFTVSHQLAEWEIVLQLPEHLANVGKDGTMILRVLFPVQYPAWAPHLIVTHPRIRSCTKASQLLIAGGGINAESLLQNQSQAQVDWSPTYRVPNLVRALQQVIAEGALTLDAGTYTSQEILWAMQAHKPGVHVHPMPRSDLHRSAAQPLEISLPEPTCSPAFAEVLEASCQFRAALGGAPSFPGGRVLLAGKLTRRDLQGHTAFEHVQLTVQGLAKLEEILPEVRRLNNGRHYMANPGTQLLERECGFTMHADRPGTAAVLQDAPALLLRTFEVAKSAGQLAAFFFRAFDRHSDPCLEGRVSLLVAFLEEHLADGDLSAEPARIGAADGEASGAGTTSDESVGVTHTEGAGGQPSVAAGSEMRAETALVKPADTGAQAGEASGDIELAAGQPSVAEGSLMRAETAPVKPADTGAEAGEASRVGTTIDQHAAVAHLELAGGQPSVAEGSLMRADTAAVKPAIGQPSDQSNLQPHPALPTILGSTLSGGAAIASSLMLPDCTGIHTHSRNEFELHV